MCLTILFVDPRDFVLVSLFSMAVVPFTIFNIITGPIYFLRNKNKIKRVFVFIILVFSIYNISKLYEWNSSSKPTNDKTLSVLSFNASFFRIPVVYTDLYFNPKRPTINDRLIQWISNQKADVLLLQEFFNDEKSPFFNNVKYLLDHGYEDFYYLNNPMHANGTSRGIAIFSKYPILKKKSIFLSANRFNGAIYIDVLKNEDTVRVVNLHLESAAFRFRKAKSDIRVFRHESMKLLYNGRLKAHQMHNVLSQIYDCKYPLLLGGDFNSTRYSYAYNETKKYFKNTFETVGNGFGFTNSGKLKFPLKIDHQFYNDRLKPIYIHAVDSITYSDHLPIKSLYQIE